jgi:hypothetical protein
MTKKDKPVTPRPAWLAIFEARPRLASFLTALVLDSVLFPAVALLVWGGNAWFPIVLLGTFLVLAELGLGVGLLASKGGHKYSLGLALGALLSFVVLFLLLIFLGNSNYWIPPA